MIDHHYDVIKALKQMTSDLQIFNENTQRANKFSIIEAVSERGRGSQSSPIEIIIDKRTRDIQIHDRIA